jgi:methylmalonyl-CoA/ethylmalonyl-CoA epimerase
LQEILPGPKEIKLISRIDHVSIAVQDYEKARRFFQDILGATPGAGDHNHHNHIYWQMFSLGDSSRLELIYPTGPKGLLSKFLEKKDGGVHHLTLQTPDIQKAKKMLEDHSIPYFGYNEYGDAWKEMFIHPRDAFGVLIQIAEFHPDDWLNPLLVLPKGKKWEVKTEEKGCTLNVVHPGGGKVAVELTAAEVKQLIDDLEQRD